MNSEELIKHYQSLLEKHGAGPAAIQWTDAETQLKRFQVLSEVSPKLTSVLDVGCGLGDLYHFLRARGFDGTYTGVDIVPEFIEIAQNSMGEDSKATAQHMAPGAPLPKGCDYAILSGVFNNRMDDNWGFMTSMLKNMYDSANHAIAFNAMTSHVDFKDDGLFYVDPNDVLNFCKTELGGHPVLRHDYVLRDGGFPFEFAVYVYKSPQSVKIA